MSPWRLVIPHPFIRLIPMPTYSCTVYPVRATDKIATLAIEADTPKAAQAQACAEAASEFGGRASRYEARVEDAEQTTTLLATWD